MIRWDRDELFSVALGVTFFCGAVAGCSAESAEPGSSASGTPAVGGASAAAGDAALGGTAPGTAGSSPSAGSPGTAGGTTTGGSGGGVMMPLCTTKVAAQTPLIADFEGYDGVIAPADYHWTFGGAAAGQLGVNAGAYIFGDMTAEPALTLLAGHGGNYGLTASVTNASGWGMGFGFYVLDQSYAPACIDASAYKGITMWVRGSVPTETFSFTVTMSQAALTSAGGSCTGTDDTSCKAPTASALPISMTWTQVDILWADLIGGLSGPATPLAANGDNITGFGFSANLKFEPESEGSETYVPVPGDVTVVVDDIAFIP
jgi:hypothetical protein